MKNTASDTKKTDSRPQPQPPRPDVTLPTSRDLTSNNDQTDYSTQNIPMQNGSKNSCCKVNEELNIKLSMEKSSLENELKEMTRHFGQKVCKDMVRTVETMIISSASFLVARVRKACGLKIKLYTRLIHFLPYMS